MLKFAARDQDKFTKRKKILKIKMAAYKRVIWFFNKKNQFGVTLLHCIGFTDYALLTFGTRDQNKS